MYKSYSELGGGDQRRGVVRDQFSVTELQSFQQKKDLISSVPLVCIDIYADWCGPCKQTADAYSTLASMYGKDGLVAIVKYNYERMEQQERAGITGIPIFEFWLYGNMVEKIIGADIDKVESTIKSLMGQLRNPSDPRRIPTDMGPTDSGQGGYANVSLSQETGPQYNRNSIKASKGMMPSMEYGGRPSTGGEHTMQGRPPGAIYGSYNS